MEELADLQSSPTGYSTALLAATEVGTLYSNTVCALQLSCLQFVSYAICYLSTYNSVRSKMHKLKQCCPGWPSRFTAALTQPAHRWLLPATRPPGSTATTNIRSDAIEGYTQFSGCLLALFGSHRLSSRPGQAGDPTAELSELAVSCYSLAARRPW